MNIVDTLAAYRLTRLLQVDGFPPAAAVRELATARPGDLKDMFECPWCLGMWVSLGVVIMRRTLPKTWNVLSQALAMSVFVALFREAEEAFEWS